MTGPAITTSTSRIDWDLALCRNEDPDLFFTDGYSVEARHSIKVAKAICRQCPLRDICLTWALETDQQHGVWGATSAKDRRLLTKPSDQPVCETCGDIVDRQGKRPVCSSCLALERQVIRDRRATILTLANQGLTNQAIAEQTGLATRTVSEDLRHIRERGVRALAGRAAPAEPCGVDMVKVERAMKGVRVDLNKQERKEAVRRLNAKGVTVKRISAILNMSSGQIRIDLAASADPAVDAQATAVEVPAA